MSRSLRSTEGSAYPAEGPLPRPTGLTLAHVGSFVRPGTLLGLVLWLLLPFVAALGQFWCVLARSGLDFVRFQMAPGRILKLQGLIFRRFCTHARLRGRNALNVTKPQF